MRRRERPGEQLDRGEGAQQHLDRADVLVGEDPGGGQEGGLSAAVEDLEHGAQRDHRLAAADVPLQEALHGRRSGQVGRDLLADGSLPGRQTVGEAFLEPFGEPSRPGRVGGAEAGPRLAGALGERSLQDEGLLVGHARAGELPRLVVVGGVECADRLVPGGKAALPPVGRGQRVGEVVLAQGRQDGLDGSPDVPRGQPFGRGVDGDGPLELGHVLFVLDELVVRMGQLQAAAVGGDRPREAGDRAGGELALVVFEGARALGEEGEAEVVEAVGDAHGQDVPAAGVHGAQGRVRHPGDHRDGLPFAHLGDGHELAAVGEPKRDVEQEVAYRMEADFRHRVSRPRAQSAFERTAQGRPAVGCDGAAFRSPSFHALVLPLRGPSGPPPTIPTLPVGSSLLPQCRTPPDRRIGGRGSSSL